MFTKTNVYAAAHEERGRDKVTHTLPRCVRFCNEAK